MGEALQLVAERCQIAVASGVLERAGEQPIGKNRVAREQRAMKVGADRSGDSAALVPGRPVVPVPRNHAPERCRTGIEERAPGVILEAGHRRRDPVEIDVEEHVADQPFRTRDRLDAGRAPAPGIVDPSRPR